MGEADGRGWKAIVLGGTGAIGHWVVTELIKLDEFTKVTLISRRHAGFIDNLPNKEKVKEVILSSLDEMENNADAFTDEDYDVAFCCLGTTRKDAGSAAAFRKVDLDSVLSFARLCLVDKKSAAEEEDEEEKTKRELDFHVVSSAGANPKSWFLYMRTKGEMEEGVKAMPFRRTVIYRPGLLGREDRARTNEKLFGWIVKAIPVQTVGRAMVHHALELLTRKKEEEAKKQSEVWGNADIYRFMKNVPSSSL
ncbi:Oxidoreductase htatip2 [Balamuthia mandrillaris]